MFMAKPAVSTGYEALDQALLNGGWPNKSLVEICQNGFQGEWPLFCPVLKSLEGLIILVNPPARPFCQAFLKADIDLERVLIVSTPDQSAFIATFVELARASVSVVMAWEPKTGLTYTEVRKCFLASQEGGGLYFLFRPAAMQKQNSPASLRAFVQLIGEGLEITPFKQKGHLLTQQPRPVILPLPVSWRGALPYHALNEGQVYKKSTERRKAQLANVIPLRGQS